MRYAISFCLLASALLLPGLGQALDPPKPNKSSKAVQTTPGTPRKLSWDDLLPAEELEGPPEISSGARPLFDDESGPAAMQEGSSKVNPSLNGQTVKLPGFVVPLAVDAKSRVSEFLLVPYFGACIHVPPPPPNQIVHVIMAQPMQLKSMYDAIWVTGKLSTQGVSSELASAAYSLAGVKTEDYVYE
jgi:uncharacterized protein